MKVLPGLPDHSVIKALAAARGLTKRARTREVTQQESPFSSASLQRLERRIRARCAANDETGCLEYQGGLGAGYGRVKWRGKLYGAHRLMAFCAGIIDRIEPGPDRYVLHSCDNRKCCNPDHLRRGTQSENMREVHSKKASPLLPKQG